jgi:YesN/AraC family two-component response regulator
LLREFCEYVVKPFLEGGISEALMDLMRKAVEEQKKGKPQQPIFSQMKNSVESLMDV